MPFALDGGLGLADKQLQAPAIIQGWIEQRTVAIEHTGCLDPIDDQVQENEGIPQLAQGGLDGLTLVLISISPSFSLAASLAPTWRQWSTR
jgi:hypothetical protein